MPTDQVIAMILTGGPVAIGGFLMFLAFRNTEARWQQTNEKLLSVIMANTAVIAEMKLIVSDLKMIVQQFVAEERRR